MHDSTFVFEKVDIFSYAYKKLEALVSKAYLQAIDSVPLIYRWLYRKNACNQEGKERFVFFEALFKRAMINLLDEKRPDLIVCTHALPSYILDCLKRDESIDIPVVNVYTDYFINTIWGWKSIDYHFVPDVCFKKELIKQGVRENTIFVTGIPLHPFIRRNEASPFSPNKRTNLLITGGSLGVGGLDSLARRIRTGGNIFYYILCGTNKRLYNRIKKDKNPHFQPLAYIGSRRAMNSLYDRMDAIITKPGGVTISESLSKRIPVFITHALPGQEEMNLSYLLQHGLVFDVRHCTSLASLEKQLQQRLLSQAEMQDYGERVERYHKRIQDHCLLLPLKRVIHQSFA